MVYLIIRPFFLTSFVGLSSSANAITPRLIEIDDLVSGERFTDKADVLINSGGLLNNFKWPDLNGLSTFKGKVVHSAAWDEKYAARNVYSVMWPSMLTSFCRFDYSNKRIGIIGGGSSAIQIIPQLQKLEGNKLVCFIRSKTWISYLFGHAAQQKLKMEDSKCERTIDVIWAVSECTDMEVFTKLFLEIVKNTQRTQSFITK